MNTEAQAVAPFEAGFAVCRSDVQRLKVSRKIMFLRRYSYTPSSHRCFYAHSHAPSHSLGSRNAVGVVGLVKRDERRG
jgi:hypothetical protein